MNETNDRETVNGWAYHVDPNGAVEATSPNGERHVFANWNTFWEAAHGQKNGSGGKTFAKVLAGVIVGIIVLYLVLYLVGHYGGSETSTSSSPPPAAVGNAQTMISETGCPSHYSEDKKADLFNAGYKNRVTTATGQIVKIDGGEVLLKILPTTLTYDLQVNLRNKSEGYSLQQGQVLTVRFMSRSAGGCFLPFSGDGGVIQ
jgi:hypothetical protein